jgi:UDP-3-O-[3-hydroxymyristoyl] glucosamine N-acyltransferase
MGIRERHKLEIELVEQGEVFLSTAGSDLVRYYYHPNGGGLVAITAIVTLDVYVGRMARVDDRAIVTRGVRLEGSSRIAGDAFVSDGVRLRDHALIDGRAVVSGNVRLRRRSRITDLARVDGHVSLDYFAKIGGATSIIGSGFAVEG